MTQAIEVPLVQYHQGQQAKWYRRLSSKAKDQLRDHIEEAVTGTAELLMGRLLLPGSICVSFMSSDNYAAVRKPRGIRFSEQCYELLQGNCTAIFRGITAHELSHLSDLKTQNDCTEPSRIHDIVSEGKDDVVGLAIGGKAYSQLCDELPGREEKIAAYRMFAGGKEKVGRSRMRISDIADEYTVGFSLVNDVVAHVGAEDIFAVHSERVSFFQKHAAAIVKSYEASA